MMFHAQNYLNRPMFQGVIQKMTLAQFFLRHGVHVYYIERSQSTVHMHAGAKNKTEKNKCIFTQFISHTT